MICGVDLSYYSMVNYENLSNIDIISKNETNELLIDVDLLKLKESFYTYLISLNDHSLINNFSNNTFYHNVSIPTVNISIPSTNILTGIR